jgi:hypothetical protein
MDLFEYLMVMVSLIVGLGLTQVLRGVGRIVRSSRRFSVVTLWAVFLFLLYIQMWWSLWDLRDLSDWTQFSFVYVIGIPCSLFATTELLLPQLTAPDIDWREHFFSVRPWLLGVFAVFLLLSHSWSYVLGDLPLTHPYRLAQAFQYLPLAVGLASTRPKVHLTVVSILIVGLVIAQVAFRFLPAAL